MTTSIPEMFWLCESIPGKERFRIQNVKCQPVNVIVLVNVYQHIF